MERLIVARSQGWSGEGIEHLVLIERPGRILAEGRDIDVDANGLVVTYPGLFRRIL